MCLQILRQLKPATAIILDLPIKQNRATAPNMLTGTKSQF